ncbi:hypothetical protein [Haloarchaeobius sp. DFWS5]|uniref:hypothetical protein n=1 Tax=Haloarchaeobius sp. DFWS5 TaxID=3446114 RepID=UPI003EB87574
MSDTTFDADAAQPAYNLAYLVDDRSFCYHEYAVDSAYDGGYVDPRTGREDAPPDFGARRSAILEFYGHRCGRCGCGLGDATDGQHETGYLYSVVSATGEGDEWALSNLVAVCEPCYTLLTTDCPEGMGGFGAQAERAPQFPVWTCDPRVAVERLPLSGKEVWLRDQLAARVGAVTADETVCGGPAVNAPVARDACLARNTNAAMAVALGEALILDEQGPLSTTNRRLTDRWDLLTVHEQAACEERAVSTETVIGGGGFEPCVDLQRA